MDYQYFPHRHIADLERQFEHKMIALSKLRSIGLDCPYISSTKSLEQLYLDEVQKDFNCDETEYLKNGIIHIFECLMVIKNEVPVTENGAIKLLWKEHGDFFLRNRKLEGFGDEEEKTLIANMLNVQNKKDTTFFLNSTNALSRELAEFKMRLSRRGIETMITDDEIEFLDLRFPIPEPEYPMIDTIEHIEVPEQIKENLYPDIFLDYDAFLLFNRLHAIFKNTKTQRADYGFIYWKMWNDGLIVKKCKPEKFRTWIGEEEHNITTSAPFRTLQGCTTQLKEDLYNTIKTIR